MQLEVELSFETQMFEAESGVCNGRQMQREQLHFVGNLFFRTIPLFSFSPALNHSVCMFVCICNCCAQFYSFIVNFQEVITEQAMSKLKKWEKSTRSAPLSNQQPTTNRIIKLTMELPDNLS